MANDIKMKWDNDLMEADVVLSIGDLEREEGLETAVIMSLFTNGRVDIDEKLLADKNNREGWWGDQYADVETDRIGSKLWLLLRSTTTEETLEKAKIYAYEALEWMIEDGVASEIKVEVERQEDPGEDRLAFKLKVYKDYGDMVAEEFSIVWNKQFGLN